MRGVHLSRFQSRLHAAQSPYHCLGRALDLGLMDTVSAVTVTLVFK